MPFGAAAGFPTGQAVTAAEIHRLIKMALGPLAPVNNGQVDGEARLFRLPEARGIIGFISPVTAPFCEACNRARLTADGMLRMCLLCEDELDLLTPMRNGASQPDLQKMVMEAVWNKPWGQKPAGGVIPPARALSEIGG